MVKTIQTGKPIDFSIIPSFRCNLNCWFCMYDCGPDNKTTLDYYKTLEFIMTFDWSQINAFGFYGGEPSIEMELYDDFIAMIPKDIYKFVITNGSWSTNSKKAVDFLRWCHLHSFHVIVSGTPEHVLNQNRSFLEELHDACPDGLELKKPDEIHAQGRAANHDWVEKDCKFTCRRTDRNMRLGLRPDGKVIFQNCHGEYHTVQTYNEPFDGIYERAKKIADNCYESRIKKLSEVLT